VLGGVGATPPPTDSDSFIANWTNRVGTGRQTRTLNEAQRLHFRGVRVALGTGYNRVGEVVRAWRNGCVGRVSSSLPRESLFVRFATPTWPCGCEGEMGGRWEGVLHNTGARTEARAPASASRSRYPRNRYPLSR
jgi:hypothetical protein